MLGEYCVEPTKVEVNPMLFAQNTMNSAGVAICGDGEDFAALYDALHNIVGEVGDHPGYESASYRVLGICYDLRHAMMGDRDFVFMDNNLNEYALWPEEAPDENLYLKIHVLWPEMLFVQMVLNDLIYRHAASLASKQDHRMALVQAKAVWDDSIAATRLLQAAVAQCLRDTLTPSAYRRLLTVMTRDTTDMSGYTAQFVDILNIRFLKMKPDVRRRSISRMGKWLAERGKDYEEVSEAVIKAALHYRVLPSEIRAPVRYPEVIDW